MSTSKSFVVVWLRSSVIAVFAFFVVVACASRLFAQGLEVGASGAIRVEIAHVDATVEESVARVEVDETFRNTTGAQLQGVYRFQLPVDAVVGSFSMWMAGKERQGRVLEAREARATYDSIVRKRKDPALLEQIGWREFKVDVFPIPAHDTVRVKLAYAYVVRDDLGLETLEVELPQQCGPVGDLQVHVKVASAHGLASLDSPSHANAKLELLDEHAGVATLVGDGVEPAGPFVLRMVPHKLGFDVALLADRPAGSESGHFVARVVPRLEKATPIPRAVVFVVDRSGSMEGRKLEQAQAALLAGLATLRSCDRFDVVSFASDVTTLGEGKLLDGTRDELARARSFAKSLEATGGTNLAGALGAALEARKLAGDRLFVVVLLTDGDPTVGETNADRILAKWRERSGGARLFAFGVGDDVKEFLLTKLAVEGRGEARYVREEQNLEVPLAALFERLRTPLLVDPTLAVEGGGVEVGELEPRRLPDLFQGRALVVTGRFKGAGAATLHLRGRSSAGVVDVAVPVDFAATTPPRPHVAQIWAKARVERLLDDLRVGGANAELRAEVTSLGLKHQLVTPYTSFLVVEDEPRVPSAPTSGGAAAASGDTARATTSLGDRPAAIDDGSTTIDRKAVPIDADDGDAASGGTAIGVGEVGHHGTGVPSVFTTRRVGGGGGRGVGGVTARAGAATATLACPGVGQGSFFGRHQSPDGRWDPATFDAQCSKEKCGGVGESGHDVEATALVLLSYFGAGETHVSGSSRNVVKQALHWLLAAQHDDGSFTTATTPDATRQQLVGALALVEAFDGTRESSLEDPARSAVDVALRSRLEKSGWSSASGGSLDLESTAWGALLLRAAGSTEPGLDAAALKQALAEAASVVDHAFRGEHGEIAAAPREGAGGLDDGTAIAASLYVWLAAGRAVADDDLVKWGTERVLDDVAERGQSTRPVDERCWFFASLAMRQVGGAAWTTWIARLQSLQRRMVEEKSRDDVGSWAAEGPVAARLGRIGATALDSLAMELYYRYPRVVGTRSK